MMGRDEINLMFIRCSMLVWTTKQLIYEKKGSYDDTNCYKILYEKRMPISEGINTHMRSMLFFSCVWVGEGVHYPF